jgi:hypothetical protein
LGNLLFGDRNPVPVDPPTCLVFQNTTRVRLDLVPLEVEVSEVQDHVIVTLQNRRYLASINTTPPSSRHTIVVGRPRRISASTNRRWQLAGIAGLLLTAMRREGVRTMLTE